MSRPCGTPELLALAGRYLDRVFRAGFAYQKRGVVLTPLAPSTTAKGDLFDTRDRERERWLMAAVDAVNARFGAGAVRFAGAVPDPKLPAPVWRPRAAMTSPHFTTAWADLPVVRC